MKIAEQDVRRIAKLARLNIDKFELHAMTENLNSVIEFASQISEVDTSNCDECMIDGMLTNVFRDDIVVNQCDRENMLKNAPSQEAGCFLVPKMVE